MTEPKPNQSEQDLIDLIDRRFLALLQGVGGSKIDRKTLRAALRSILEDK